jgi:hypothetical protein
MEKMLNAWETLTPTKSYGGMTLEEFQEAARPAQAARRLIDDLEDQLTRAIRVREDSDVGFSLVADRIVSGVKADPTEGPDSPVLSAMGYVRKSERKSGLTRKKRKPSDPGA